jgi:hypothetical protein
LFFNKIALNLARKGGLEPSFKRYYGWFNKIAPHNNMIQALVYIRNQMLKWVFLAVK